jgi:proteasome lid subunit RPN8/RPN11
MHITLTTRQLAELEDLAKQSLPNESCALLLGKESSVVEVLTIANAGLSEVSFTIPSEELLTAYKLAESKELEVIGIFHSHPSSPVPSRTDEKYMEINPVVWLIYSTTQNRFGAWVFDDKVREVKMVVRA